MVDPDPVHSEGGRHATRGTDGFGTLLRRRWRRAVFLIITAWLCGAIAVVFFRGLGDAERSGAAESLAAQYQRYLGPGWYPLEVDQLGATTKGAAPGWLGLNPSRGSMSTIMPTRGWTTLRLRLAPVGCSDHPTLSVVARQGASVLKTFTPAPGWFWYSLRIDGPAPVTLHYSCLTIEQSPGQGLQSARRIAVLLSGVAG